MGFSFPSNSLKQYKNNAVVYWPKCKDKNSTLLNKCLQFVFRARHYETQNILCKFNIKYICCVGLARLTVKI